MTTAKQGSSGGGLFSKLVVVLLLAIAIGLYLRIVMVEGSRQVSERPPQVSMQVLEGKAAPAAAPPAQQIQDLPQDQMDLIKRVFAPELLN